ncbi:uncharacterized protein LOC110980639 isoform X3 [Acanthaster planci]|nr:uncharacterized protein LOC110980639 isoform X3 [Acanthaster planci]
MDEETSKNQKIAIVGIGCRFGNGVNSVKTLWEVLVKGLDCTTPIPPDRFDASYFLSPGEKTAGKIYIQNGGYISQDPYMFDRQFFHMPPDEAAHLDPQVRLLLEVTWEALENAGIPPSSLRGSKTGVYMGVTAQEYLSFAWKPFHNMNQYSNSGNNSCMVSNRISYEFDLRGPSFSVDTACSSSLYSIYLACEALKQKSCSMALAGGVNLILTPTTTIGFCQAGMLSLDGKCKSFDQAADGYSRSEGAGVLVLKPLDDALHNGDRIYGVIRGGALSNDGRTLGIANPSFDAQVDLVKSACRNAGVDPLQIVYAEAHGTGTRVGDTTEAGALGEVLGRRRGPKHPPLYIGSVKSNVGHSEGAAGVAGIIKTALCLYNRKIPPVVHFKTPNENVDFKLLKMNVPTELISWPHRGDRFLSCCSSFGFGGANANLILEGHLSPSGIELPQMKGKTLSCLLLSAASSNALRQKFKDWVDFLTEDPSMNDNTFFSCLYTAACRSQHLVHRAGFAVYSKEDAIHQLRMKLDNESYHKTSTRHVEGVATSVSGAKQQIVFVFSGMGTQWWGMGRELMETQPIFAARVKVIDEQLKRCGAKWSLVSMLSDEKDRERIHKTEISQPCLFALAIGLLDLWKFRGLVPDAVVGHSAGEVAAAYAAGLLSLEHAVKLVYRRGIELGKTSGSGKMVAVLCHTEEALRYARESKHGQMLDVAAINSPGQIVFSGANTAVEGLAKEFKINNIKCVVLKVDNAFHSKEQEVIRSPFLKEASKFLKVQNAEERVRTIPMMSTVTGRYLTTEEANTPEYWFQNARQRVLFMNSIQKLAKDGYRVFVEVGTHSSLLPALQDTLATIQFTDDKFITSASLLRPRDTITIAKDSENLMVSQLRLYTSGIPVIFDGLFNSTYRQVMSVPHYPWQREKCTNICPEGKTDLLFPVGEGQHVLLGEPIETFHLQESPVRIWRAKMDASRVPWVKDHVLQGSVIVPATAYTETALAAARSMNGYRYPIVLSGLMFDRFMFAPNAEGCLETTVEEKTAEQFLVTLRSHDVSKGTWTQHCHVRIIPPSAADPGVMTTLGEIMDVDSISKRCEVSIPGEVFYNNADDSGFDLGSTFRGVQKMLTSQDSRESLVYAEAPLSVRREFHRYVYHPAFMDSFLQAFAVLILLAEQGGHENLDKRSQPVQRVPRQIQTLTFTGPSSPHVCIHVRISGGDHPNCDIDVADANTKSIFCSVRGLVFETIQNDNMEHQIWSVVWENVGSVDIKNGPVQSQTASKKVIVFPDNTDVSTSLIDTLVKQEVLDVTVIDVEKADAVQKAVTMVAANQDTETLLVMMKTEVSDVHLNSGSVMSRREFEGYQKDTLFCYSVCKALQRESLKAQFLLFTKGAHHAIDGDYVNPFSAILNTVGVIVSHEEPLLTMFSVDLPITESSMESSQIACEIIYKKDCHLYEEDVIAARKSRSTKRNHNSKTWDLLSPRVRMENLSNAPAIVPARLWSVGEKKMSDRVRVFVRKIHPKDLELNTDQRFFRVKVEAFGLCNNQQFEVDGRSGTNTFIYAGSLDGYSSKKQTKTYLGLSCTDVQTYMKSLSQDLIEVPSYLTPRKAVSIVIDYLPPAVFFEQAVPVSPGMRVGFKCDSLDSYDLATIHLSTKMGAETVVLKDAHNDLFALYNEISVKSLNELEEASIDVMFLSLKSSSLDRTLHSLQPKLRGNATVVIIQRQKHEKRLPMLPSKMKIVTFDTYLPSALDGLSSSKISAILSYLWEMFNPKLESGHLTCITGNHIRLSSLAARNADIPKNEVIEVDSAELLLPPSVENDGFVADRGSAYFVTGGTKGFGLKLTEWLISRGARYIYAGSRGEMNEELKEVIEKGKEVGAQVRHIRLDVSSASDVEIALRKMMVGQWPALRGIFHCAAVFEDGFLQNITAESWNRVMAAKAHGALLLHQLTLKLGIKLDHFIMTSSILSLIGNAGQGSYCAANVFLNALAYYRHNHNLPATAVQIGVINDVGFIVRRGLVQAWEKTGAGSMSPKEVLGVIGSALSVRQTQLGISAHLNRKLWAERHRGLIIKHFKEKHGTLSFMKELFHDRDVYLAAINDTFLQSIVKLPLTKARDLVIKTLAQLFSQHLGLSNEPPHDASPISLGLDSLMASEVSQQISQKFQVIVGAVDLLNDKNTIQEISKNITRQLFAKTASSSPNGLEGERSAVLKQKTVVVEGEVPKPLAVKLVCFPTIGGGPSLFTHWTQPMLPFGIQVLMIQLPGWEGREDEQPLTNMKDIARLVYHELAPHISKGPFVFFGHSMGSLVAFEVAHLLYDEDNICPHHLFVSSWYAPTLAYPYTEELDITPSTFDRLKEILEDSPKLFASLAKQAQVKFSFIDDKTFFNTAFMKRLLPCLQASTEIIRDYKCKHENPLPCDLTVFGGKQDAFAKPDLLNGWEQERSRKHSFNKIIFPGKHMYILTSTAQVLEAICLTWKKDENNSY